MGGRRLYLRHPSGAGLNPGEILPPPSVDRSVDEVDIGKPQVGFQQGIHHQRADALGADAGDEKHEFPGKLHQHADSEDPGQVDPLPRVLGAYIVPDKGWRSPQTGWLP